MNSSDSLNIHSRIIIFSLSLSLSLSSSIHNYYSLRFTVTKHYELIKNHEKDSWTLILLIQSITINQPTKWLLVLINQLFTTAVQRMVIHNTTSYKCTERFSEIFFWKIHSWIGQILDVVNHWKLIATKCYLFRCHKSNSYYTLTQVLS